MIGQVTGNTTWFFLPDYNFVV